MASEILRSATNKGYSVTGRALASAQMYIPLLTSNFINIGAGKRVTGNARSRIYTSIFK